MMIEEKQPIDQHDLMLIAEAHTLYQHSFGTLGELAALAHLRECVRHVFARAGIRLEQKQLELLRESEAKR